MAVACCCISHPVARNVVTGSADHTLKLWNFYGNVLRTYTGHSSEVLPLTVSLRVCWCEVRGSGLAQPSHGQRLPRIRRAALAAG